MIIGSDLVRADGPAKVCGTAKYVDDVRPAGCVYAFAVRSPHAHARIDSITLDPAYDWSNVTVCTAADVPGENVVALMTDDQPVLADGIVRHATEPVALVAAPSRDEALEAVQHVHVAYTPLPALRDMTVAKGNEIKVFGDDNVFSEITIDHGDVDSAFGPDATIVEGTYDVGHQEQLYIETQGMIAIPREGGGLTLFGSMQCPYYIVKALKRVLGLGPEDEGRLNVVQAVTGGGFGGKEEYPSILAAHAAVVALKTGKPVKMIYRRDEDLRATTKRHPALMTYKAAVEPSTGKLLGVKAHLLFDGGAYNTLSPVVNSRAVIHAIGAYACPNVRIEGLMVATNTTPNGAFRGFGAPQAMFAAERHMDTIARQLGLDPVKVRQVNLYRDGDVTPTGQTLYDVGATLVFDAAVERADAPLPPSWLPQRAGGGRDSAAVARGRGLALAWHGCGFTGNGEAAIKGKADVAIEGDEVVIYTASTDIGQGTDTIFPTIVAEVLSIDPERVRNAEHDTAKVPDSGPTVASRTTMIVGGVVKKAAHQLMAALEAEVGVGKDHGLSFDALVARRKTRTPLRVQAEYVDESGLQWDKATYQGDAYPTYGWSCVIVDVDVDLDTGEVLYRRLVQATDVGKALNRTLCSGQLEGGAIQALGYATQEEVVLDDQGAMANNRLTNYIIPTALDAPPMETVLIEIPYAGGPFGAKGIGEIPHDVPAAAVAQAIEQATGAVLHTLPMTPERVLAAMEADND